MATKRAKSKTAPADGASTAGELQAAWPFPRATPKVDDDEPAVQTPAPERIHVDQVNLYADPTKNTVEQIAIEQLVESPFNPRSTFNQAELEELAQSMRSVGVMQAILVRPVTLAGGFEIRKGDESLQAYEIIFGHRRSRAAKLAGLGTIPCIVRELADTQAAQLQAIENVQRKDLDPLEEALGYKHYLDTHGVTKDQLADEVGLSRTHVYSRLKLLNAVPLVQDALRDGEIGAEIALLVARIHTPKLQERALAAIKSKYYDMEDGGKKSFRQIRELLREKFALNIKDAMFDGEDAALVENAGTCSTCPKRSGNAPEYADLAGTRGQYSDGSGKLTEPNLCTDPDCFEAKTKAHLRNKAQALEAKGKTVIAGGKARAAIGADGRVKGAYIALKDVKAELAKKSKKPGVDVPTVVIQNPRDGKTVEAVALGDLKAAGVKVKEQAKAAGGGRYDYEAENRKREAKRQKEQEKAAIETRVNCGVLNAVRLAAAGKPIEQVTLHMIVMATLKGVDYEQRDVLALMHDCKSFSALEKKVGQMPAEKLTTLMLDCALVQGVVDRGYGRSKPTNLLEAAKHFGVDIAQIRKDVSAMPADTKSGDLLKPQQEEEEAEEA